MIKLLLDDKEERTPYNIYCYMKDPEYLQDDWRIVRNYDEFVNFITDLYDKAGIIPSVISFDHDLADEHYVDTILGNFDYNNVKEKTGKCCAEWFVYFCMDNNLDPLSVKILVHSMNPVGSANIRSVFNTYKKLKDRGII
jgi:hypothetical protein